MFAFAFACIVGLPSNLKEARSAIEERWRDRATFSSIKAIIVVVVVVSTMRPTTRAYAYGYRILSSVLNCSGARDETRRVSFQRKNRTWVRIRYVCSFRE